MRPDISHHFVGGKTVLHGELQRVSNGAGKESESGDRPHNRAALPADYSANELPRKSTNCSGNENDEIAKCVRHHRGCDEAKCKSDNAATRKLCGRETMRGRALQSALMAAISDGCQHRAFGTDVRLATAAAQSGLNALVCVAVCLPVAFHGGAALSLNNPKSEYRKLRTSVRYAFACSTRAVNAAGSEIASSLRILRSI